MSPPIIRDFLGPQKAISGCCDCSFPLYTLLFFAEPQGCYYLCLVCPTSNDLLHMPCEFELFGPKQEVRVRVVEVGFGWLFLCYNHSTWLTISVPFPDSFGFYLNFHVFLEFAFSQPRPHCFTPCSPNQSHWQPFPDMHADAVHADAELADAAHAPWRTPRLGCVERLSLCPALTSPKVKPHNKRTSDVSSIQGGVGYCDIDVRRCI